MTKFKFALASALIIGSAATALAEGYQINTLSARQLGMGHTGTALKIGAENMIFNPAGLAFSDKAIDINASLTGIAAIATARHEGVKYTTDNGISTPLALNAAFKVYNNLQVGLSFYTPYGSGINWGEHWAGATLNQKVSLKSYTIQPTVAWRVTNRLSIGGGLMLSWGSVNLSKGLFPGSSLDAILTAKGLGALANYAGTSPVSVNLKGTSDMAFGVHLGVMYDINEQWTIGASWRSKMGLKVKKGDATLNYAIENENVRKLIADQLDVLNNANFSAEMPMPQTIKLGAAYKPNNRLTLAADIQFTGWKTYDQLCIDFDSSVPEKYDQTIEKKYHNAYSFNMGAEYKLTDRFDIRGGLIIDTTPVDKHFYNPETPGMTKIEPTVGFSFHPIENLAVNFSFMYVQGVGRNNCSVKYPDLLLSTPEHPVENNFTADYRVRAFNPSIGLSYSF